MARDVDAGWEESIPLSIEQRVDDVCDRFEAAWRDGQRPPVEDFLGSRDGMERSAVLFELVTLEIAYRGRRGEHLGLEEYLARFPDDAKLIESALESLLPDEPSRGQDAEEPHSSIPVTCPAGHAFRVDAKHAGQTGKCAFCDERVEVAAPPPAAAVDTSAASQGETIVWEPDDETGLPATKQSERRAGSQQIGRFRIIDELGKGAFGTVYRAYDPRLEREVALKVPRKGVFETEEELERFLREARAAATLHHPNICPVYETGKDGERHYIAMGYIAGTTLDAIIRGERSVGDREAVIMVRKLALALDEAHRAGIIHRDLKPSNIMIDQRGEPVIMDFGLARRIKADEAQLTHDGQILGTPAYMPPEQARGEIEKIGPASDVFSLGTILYELLCGRRPFQGSVAELISQVLRDDPEPPSTHRPDLDARLDAICVRTMAKAVEKRCVSMRELADALDEYLQSPDAEAAGAETALDPPSTDSARLGAVERPLASASPVRRRRNWRWIATAVTLIGLVLGVTIYLALPRGKLVIQVLDDDVKVIVFRGGEEVTIIDTKTDTQIKLYAGQYELELSDGEPVLRLVPDRFTLRRGERKVVKVERILPDAQFTDVSQLAHVDDQGGKVGTSWADYDGDGDLDLFVAGQFGAAYTLYRNEGNGTFSNVTAEVGMADATWQSQGGVWADYDNDGRLDLYVVNVDAPNELYHNDGDRGFTEVGAVAGVNDSARGAAAAWGDYDRDGWVDLYVSNLSGGTNRLYHNLGNGRFEDVTGDMGLVLEADTRGCAWGDFDDDGDPDLVVAGVKMNCLYQNNSPHPFTNVAPEKGLGFPDSVTEAVAWGDYDNDGDLDLYFVRLWRYYQKLYRNLGNGSFEDASRAAGIADKDNGFTATWVDFDNDGDLDIHVDNAEADDDLLYTNNGNGTFSERRASEGIAATVEGFGAAWGDFDNDGDMDFFSGETGAGRLYRNNCTGRHWLIVKPIGTISNRAGIGARVKVTTGTSSQIREIRGGSGRCCQSGLWAHFGLGEVDTADVVEVHWPSGAVSRINNVQADQTLEIREER